MLMVPRTRPIVKFFIVDYSFKPDCFVTIAGRGADEKHLDAVAMGAELGFFRLDEEGIPGKTGDADIDRGICYVEHPREVKP